MLAIPHNGNLSNGLIFAIERLNGKPIDRQYAETRMRWEPIYEVTQIKGDGEAHPFLSPEDEWADYGTWDKGDIAGMKPKQNDMLQYEYALQLRDRILAEPVTAVITIPCAFVGPVIWEISWFSYPLVVWLVRRRGRKKKL